MRIYFLILILLSCISSNAQRIRGSTRLHIPRDKVKLINGDAETGKVIFYDSTKITLLKYDYSEKNILRTEIDTIVGLSYYTYFISPSFGYLHWNGLISQRLDTFSADAANLRVKFGFMRKKQFAGNLFAEYQGGNNHKLFHFGVGLRRYFFSNYVKKKNFYFGVNAGYNIPFTNMNRFFDIGWCMGYEYLLMEKYRLFLEFERSKEQKYTPKPDSFSFNIGIRFSREYGSYYKKINTH